MCSSLDEIKNAITNKAVQYFDIKLRTELYIDASPVGLGFVMSQFNPNKQEDKHVVLFGSRTLSDVVSLFPSRERGAWTGVGMREG